MSKAIVLASYLVAAQLIAKSELSEILDHLDGGLFKEPFYLLFLLIGILLLPFFAVMVTSFTKIVVVLSIARQAIGASQTPPNIVIMSLAIVLTCFSMYPVGVEIFDNLMLEKDDKKEITEPQRLYQFFGAFKEPLRTYLKKHAQIEDQKLFHKLLPQGNIPAVNDNDFIILAPAFLISELSLAFQIGFLVYLPFLVIDMTVANLLMALGMQMLSPTTISLPFKILLFVLVDGFRMLSEGLAKV